jgi:hypothetical protein
MTNLRTMKKRWTRDTIQGRHHILTRPECPIISPGRPASAVRSNPGATHTSGILSDVRHLGDHHQGKWRICSRIWR